MFSMKIQGGQALAKSLDALGFTQQRSALADILKKGAEPYQAGMRRHAPVEPGKPDLADHIAIAVTTRVSSPETIGSRARNEGEAAVAVGPEPDFFYGLFQEYGTIHHGSHPFMRPAFDEGTAAALRVIQDEIWAALRQQASRLTTAGHL